MDKQDNETQARADTQVDTDMKVEDTKVDEDRPTTVLPAHLERDRPSVKTRARMVRTPELSGGSIDQDLQSRSGEEERGSGVTSGVADGDADGGGDADADADADGDGKGDIRGHGGILPLLPPPPSPFTTTLATTTTSAAKATSSGSSTIPSIPNPDPGSSTNTNSGSSSHSDSTLGPAPPGLGVPFELKVPNMNEEERSRLDSKSRSKPRLRLRSRGRSGSRSPSASPTPSGSQLPADDRMGSRSRSRSTSRSATPSPPIAARHDTRLQSDVGVVPPTLADEAEAEGLKSIAMSMDIEVPVDKHQGARDGQSGEPGQGVNMGRLMNSIEVTKRATFLRQRLSSLGTRPTGFRPVSNTSVEDGPDNPFSSPPSSPPLHTPQANTNGLHWRDKKVPASPASPSVVLKSQSEGWKREVPRTPITPGRKRKLDFESTPFRSPGDLMALTLESPGRKGGDDAGEELANEAGGSKRRGKTWVQVQPGTGFGSGLGSRSPARRSVAESADMGLRTGRRASMGTGPRLGIALPRRAIEGDKQAPTQMQAPEQYPVQMQPRRAMGIEGYLADRYGDVMGGSRYPPPLPSPQASASTSASSPALNRDADLAVKSGHKRRTSTGVVSSPTTAPTGSDNRYVSFMTGKKPRSASHSVLRRPVLPGNRTGEMTEAANVLTGMLGGSPLRHSTASPARPERSSKPYARPNGDELGFRVPPARTRSGSPGVDTLPPLLASGQITPPKQISRLPHVRHADGPHARSGDDDDDQRAAELMIFLAQSPGSTAASGTTRSKRSSFVQGAGIGRVLFDGDDVEMRDVGRQAVAGGEVVSEG